MKQCPDCKRVYNDESLSYCLDDGAVLLDGPTLDGPPTKVLPSESDTRIAGSEVSDIPNSRDTDPQASGVTGTFVSKRKTISVLVLSAIVLLTGLWMAFRFWPARNKPITSIAVLPFENKGGDADTEYLSDGLADSIMYRLSQLPELTVSPRSVVYRYKGNESDPTKIGKDLGVDAILSGRIIERGDDLTVSVELVDLRYNKLLWGERYDRKMSELLATQRTIAQEITEKLQIKVSSDEKAIAKHYTENNEAYQLYLRGRFYWDKRTGEAVKRAIGYFDQAIKTDPGFALAYAGLADCYVVPASTMAPKDAMPQAKAAAQRALELDDLLPEAHTALARVLAAYDWDWPAAEKEYKRAIELNPRYVVAHQWYGGYLEARGHRDEAFAQGRVALELDPLSLISNFELAQGYYFARDYDRAIEQYQKTLELDSNFPPAHQFLPAAYEQKGNYPEAISRFKNSPVLSGGGEWSMTKGGLGHAYAVNGQKQEALDVIDELKKFSQQQYVSSASIALVYAGLRDNDQAFAWLDKAYDQRDFQLQWFNIEPRWDSLRSDPRFTVLLKKVGLN